MANTNDLTNAVRSAFAAQIKASIERSQSHDEIVHVTIPHTDISNVFDFAQDFAEQVDYVRENDGSYDMWGFTNESEENSTGEMEWRINVTLEADPDGINESSDAYNTGFEASKQGEGRDANPYPAGTWNAKNWDAGWDSE